ncbi:DUF3558 family protein [Streptomyces sp. NPDC003077]|uniref:DUF3558 family protein n=1 Tax=Streptomyces sp. NPDC003077 TaxID=3154443 RepID=UPI0033AEEDC7
MPRSAKRLATLLTCAAVPVMLVAGCSSSGGDKDAGSASPSASGSGSGSASSAPSAQPSSAPTLPPARFQKLPDPCAAVSKDTIKELLPKVNDEKGEPGKSSNTKARGYCAWDSSESKGVDGTQYRWLDIGFQRYDSTPGVGTGDERAKEFLTTQIDGAKAVPGAKDVKAKPVSGIGDEATLITYDLKKDGSDFKNQTVVTRTANVVVTLNYNGAGLAGADTPDGDDLAKKAQDAIKEAVAAVAK